MAARAAAIAGLLASLLLGCGWLAAATTPWNDFETCHKPTDEGCHTCLGTPSPSSGVDWRTSTNNCTGCFVGAPCEPGNCPCGRCDPGSPPWYNDIGHSDSAPTGCEKPCSNCTTLLVKNYIEAMFLVPHDSPCKCPDPKLSPPPQGVDCDCGLPGPAGNPHCCKCHCQIQAQIKLFCNLDPAPDKFPGPCEFDRLYNTSRGLKFTGVCDADGYYQTVRCGAVAPPPLPPSPPRASAIAQPQQLLPSALDVDRSAPGGPLHCWCVEPTFGIQNGTSSWRKGATEPATYCHDTIQCGLLNQPKCNKLDTFCNWTLNFGGQSYGCHNLEPPNR